jgi:hypothetical protein
MQVVWAHVATTAAHSAAVSQACAVPAARAAPVVVGAVVVRSDSCALLDLVHLRQDPPGPPETVMLRQLVIGVAQLLSFEPRPAMLRLLPLPLVANRLLPSMPQASLPLPLPSSLPLPLPLLPLPLLPLPLLPLPLLPLPLLPLPSPLAPC